MQLQTDISLDLNTDLVLTLKSLGYTSRRRYLLVYHLQTKRFTTSNPYKTLCREISATEEIRVERRDLSTKGVLEGFEVVNLFVWRSQTS